MIEKVGYSVEETAHALGVGRTTVYELLSNGELESIKVGRRRIIPADAVRNYFKHQLAVQKTDHSGR